MVAPAAHLETVSHDQFRGVTDLVDFEKHRANPARWPRLMNRDSVAEYLSVSPRHVDTLVKMGLIPPAKFRASSRMVRWDRVDLDAALDKASEARQAPGRSFDDILAPTVVGHDRRTKTGGR